MPAGVYFIFLALLVVACDFGIVYYTKNTAELNNGFYREITQESI